MPAFDPKILAEIDFLGSQTAALADQLGQIIRAAEERLDRLPSKVEATFVHWPDVPGELPIRIRFKRHPKSNSWGFFVETASTITSMNPRRAAFDSGSAVWLPEASLRTKVAAAAALPGILAAVREEQSNMVAQLRPTVDALTTMLNSLSAKGGK